MSALRVMAATAILEAHHASTRHLITSLTSRQMETNPVLPAASVPRAPQAFLTVTSVAILGNIRAMEPPTAR